MRYRGFYPLASQVGKTLVGGIDPNKPRMRQVIEALIALSPSPNGFTASEVAARVRALSKQSPCQYGPRHAGYDLKKLRGKHIVRRIGHTNFDFFSLTRACARETKKLSGGSVAASPGSSSYCPSPAACRPTLPRLTESNNHKNNTMPEQPARKATRPRAPSMLVNRMPVSRITRVF
jgi:hypothetical protein